MIEFDGVAVEVESEHTDGRSGGRLTILQPTTLRLSERRVALIGANGSGKSTLARLVNGLVDPTSGTVRVDGLDVTDHGRRVRQRVGFCFSDPGAQLVMPTAVEDVALSLRSRASVPPEEPAPSSRPQRRWAKTGRAVPRPRRRVDQTEAALRLLDEFGLGAVAHHSVHDLSGGQRQLLALVAVLAAAPSIVVADEPTTLLDLRNARAIGNRLLSLDQQLVLVTHDLELAERCDRAICLDQGRVVDDGPPGEVIDRYRRAAVATIS